MNSQLVSSDLYAFYFAGLNWCHLLLGHTCFESFNCYRQFFRHIYFNVSIGIKVDMKRKHTNITRNEYTNRSDLYTKTFENKKDLKTHMKSHSYKLA